ncbi:MAG: nucleotidyltransferase domain-containing protein [Nanoarchaeota archaeon]|nr:nucleotidyltransferase domain-containing protein [Nanoarchaeota archaeon]MBU0962437.1 nucleotidyltransferase domain-containing protein [Nanoarchaeota archaeon]
MNYKLISYGLDFTSFLLQNLGEENRKIKQIILFGSVARGEASENSDIDIFIDVLDEKLAEKIEKIEERFYDSIKVKKYWTLLGIKNEINCSIGKLEEWKDLQQSILVDGITFFGKYMRKIKTKPYYLFIIGSKKNRNKNMSIWRSLYGYTQKINKKIYKKNGLVKEYNGEKLARGVFTIPIENSQKIVSFLKKNGLKYTMTFFGENKI